VTEEGCGKYMGPGRDHYQRPKGLTAQGHNGK
jgi:hypothetical protein